MYTRQEVYHGVGERVGQDLELYYEFQKKCAENDMILNKQWAEDWRSIQINQFCSCAFCVENDFKSMTSWKGILHLST